MSSITRYAPSLVAALATTVMLALAAPENAAQSGGSAPERRLGCEPERRGPGDKDTADTLEAVRSMKKDAAADVPAEAQAVLDRVTAMFENDDSRGSADMADAMREFAGGRALRRPRC